MADTLRTLLLDSGLQKELGHNAAKLVREKYNIQKTVENLLDEYKKLL